MQRNDLPHRGLDLLLDFPQHLRPGLPPATGEKRGPQRPHPNITDRTKTHTKTETETFLATANHQEQNSPLRKTL